MCRIELIFTCLTALSAVAQISCREILEGTEATVVEKNEDESTKTTEVAECTCTELLDSEDLRDMCESHLNVTNNVSASQPIEEIPNLNDLIGNWTEREVNMKINQTYEDVNETSTSSFELDHSHIRKLNIAVFREKKYTDFTFLVGPEQQEVHAHRAILMQSSSFFKKIIESLNGKRSIKIPDVSVKIFKFILEYLYTGEACVNDFEEACEICYTAKEFMLLKLHNDMKKYLFNTIYPNNVWRAFKCALTYNDTKLKDMAIEFADKNTEETLMDPAFTDISHEALIALLSKEQLNLRSELKLLDATLRWAMAECVRKNLPPVPESMRIVLGTALSQIRFLTLSPSDFANMQSTAKLLSYTESLAVIFNINSPGVIAMPSNLSNNTKPRMLPTQVSSVNYFDVFEVPSLCSTPNQNLNHSFDLFTKRKIKLVKQNYYSNEKVMIIGVQVPSQISCSSYDEDLIVQMTDDNGRKWINVRYKEHVFCNRLLTIRISSHLTYPLTDGSYEIEILLRKRGRYPQFWNTHSKHMPVEGIIDASPHQRLYFWQFPANKFVFSVITNIQSTYRID